LEVASSATFELRSRFIAQYEMLNQPTRAAFSDARFALLEAIGCCEIGHFLASAVMSRTALEAVLYLARIQLKDSAGNPFIDGSVVRVMPDIIFPWWRLKKWAKDKKLVDKKLLANCDRVRKLGNFAAHYAEQVNRNMAGSAGGAYQVWVPPEDAYWALNVVRQIILNVAEGWGVLH
jgi:hypothetical protein